MPELPDVTIYVEALDQRIRGARIDQVIICSPFVLRTFAPPIEASEGRKVRGVSRLGKRIVLALDADLFLVMHLMIAGRLRWADGAGATPLGGRIMLASMAFDGGTLSITEASKRKRASLHLVAGSGGLEQFSRGGIDVLSADEAAFAAALRRKSRTLKRALTDPAVFDGIGNAYSDEILHAARMSPFKLTTALGDEEIAGLRLAARGTLASWTDALRSEFDDGRGGLRFPGPGEITAFRPGFAVHGRFGAPCPACGGTVWRVVYAEREFNYCPACQTGGRLLADRSLSRLFRDDWPRTAEEADEMFG